MTSDRVHPHVGHQSEPSTVTVLNDARIVTPQAVLTGGGVVIKDDRIAAVEGTEITDCDPTNGRLIIPGLVDIHGDDIEGQLFPRATARVGTDHALYGCDRTNLAAGVTTKFHAIAFENDTQDNRSLELAHELVTAIEGATSLLAEHRIHARCELADADSVDAVCRVIANGQADLVSLMTHRPGAGQFESLEEFRRRYEGDGPSGTDAEQLAVERCRTPASAIAERRSRLVAAASDAGVSLASHDDEHPAAVARLADAGIDISEFPVTMAAARRAHDRGLTTAMGAPNLVRGGSLWGNLAAHDAIDAGVIDVLCSDYRPQSLLESVFVDTGEPVPARVARVTSAPAAAVGLEDRGRIVPGARADLLVVDPSPVPTVERAFVAGTEVYRAAADGVAD